MSPGAIPKSAVIIISAAAGLWLMIAARPVLQPLLLSGLIWFLLSASAHGVARFTKGEGAEPSLLERVLTTLAFALGTVIVGAMILSSADDLRQNMPVYSDNLNRMLGGLGNGLGLDVAVDLSKITQSIDLPGIALSVAGSVAGFFSSAIIIACYVLFIGIEAGAFEAKLAALVPDEARRARAAAVLLQIRRSGETYLGMKCLLGLIQAVPTFVILTIVGVDSPVVWAVLIFLLSFIPTLGTLIGIALPSLLALIQCDTVGPFLMTIATLAPVQLFASNWLEPRMMAGSLNLSPLAVFVAIFAGGALWGIVGALISVPLLTMIAIACAQSEETRAVAILLSKDGQLDDA